MIHFEAETGNGSNSTPYEDGVRAPIAATTGRLIDNSLSGAISGVAGGSTFRDFEAETRAMEARMGEQTYYSSYVHIISKLLGKKELVQVLQCTIEAMALKKMLRAQEQRTYMICFHPREIYFFKEALAMLELRVVSKRSGY